MLRHSLLVIAISILGASAVPAKVVTLDYEQFDYKGDGNYPPICVNENHLNYCAINTYDYSHFAPYAFLSDYDWRASEVFTSDPGYVFTPKRFDILFAESYVWRLYCPDGSCIGDDSSKYDPTTYDGEFTLYDYPYLSLLGYRNDDLVAHKVLDPTGKTDLRFGREFKDIDTLEVSLLGSYFETVEIERDGYAYTCMLNMYQSCNEMGFDNFKIKVSKVRPNQSGDTFPDPSVAAVPLPASILAFLTGLSTLLGLASRRRI